MFHITQGDDSYTDRERSYHNKIYKRMVTKLLSDLDRELDKWLQEWLNQEEMILRTIPILEKTIFRSRWSWSEIFNKFKQTGTVDSFKDLISFFNSHWGS